jgi:hypothetical protein
VVFYFDDRGNLLPFVYHPYNRRGHPYDEQKPVKALAILGKGKQRE